MGRVNPTIDELKTFAELADKSYQDWIPYDKERGKIIIGDKTFTVKMF